MHRLQLLVIDLLLIALATTSALLLRENFEVSPARAEAILPYLVLTLAGGAVILPSLGSSRTIWRFTAMSDYLSLLTATLLTVAAAVLLGFAYNRLDGVARALPLLQAILMLVLLVGSRVLMRLRHARRGHPVQLRVAAPDQGETVLVVGLGRLAELYLRSVAELAPKHVRIAGLLGRRVQHIGRVMHGQKVLGRPDEVAAILRDLEVGGVLVDRIVVTDAGLNRAEREALLGVEQSAGVRVESIAELLRLDLTGSHVSRLQSEVPPDDEPLAFVIGEAKLAALARRPYWRFKRAIDFAGALALLIVVAPFLLVGAVLVAVDVGRPVTFVQQRLGLGGRPFKLYKLRTMSAAYAGGRKVPDSARTSRIGRWLRRVWLDELPQLLNILRGDMSFIGPRPLLEHEQPPTFAARLLVRPGLTGWAQVEGGRDISAANKAALDVWYITKASLSLDLQIIVSTFRRLVTGERTNAAAIRCAWRDLQRDGICASSEWVDGQRRSEETLQVAHGSRVA